MRYIPDPVPTFQIILDTDPAINSTLQKSTWPVKRDKFKCTELQQFKILPQYSHVLQGLTTKYHTWYVPYAGPDVALNMLMAH